MRLFFFKCERGNDIILHYYVPKNDSTEMLCINLYPAVILVKGIYSVELDISIHQVKYKQRP